MKIAIVLEGLGGTCPFYRSVAPFNRLRKSMGLEISIIAADAQNPNWLWVDLLDADVVYFERPTSSSAYDLFKETLAAGVPIWIDFDDNLMNIPEWSSGHMGNSHRTEIIQMCSENADLVTVSTVSLQMSFEKLDIKTQVIPNALDDYACKEGFQFSNKQTIFWRGSNTHVEDQKILLQVYEKVHEHRPDWLWIIMGGDESLLKNKKGMLVLDYIPIMSYFNIMLNIDPAILFFPLREHNFNRCKSNIAWLEATYFGAVTIAPNWSEWKRDGVLRYDNENAIHEQIINAMDDKEFRREQYEKSCEYIKDKLMLSKINLIRAELLKGLVNV